MAIYRSVQMSFWTDTKVLDDFKPEDKLMFLYLMTNPHTNLSGCYEISINQITYEIGYTKDRVENLIQRMTEEFDVIRYDRKTKELLILNWSKYNWTSSEKLRKPLLAEIESVKSDTFRKYLKDRFNGIDTVSIPYEYGSDTTVTVTDTVSDTYSESVKEIVDYLNKVCGTKYQATSDSTAKYIRGRLKENHTVEDFKAVIDVKSKEWLNNKEMKEYLRPMTLFSPSKFESYLNQSRMEEADDLDDWANS